MTTSARKTVDRWHEGMAIALVIMGLAACTQAAFPIINKPTMPVVADSGYARHVQNVRDACKDIIVELALTMPEAENIAAETWEDAYWQCLYDMGATS